MGKATISKLLIMAALIAIFFAALFALGLSDVAFWVIAIAIIVIIVFGIILDLNYDQGAYYDYGGLTKKRRKRSQ